MQILQFDLNQPNNIVPLISAVLLLFFLFLGPSLVILTIGHDSINKPVRRTILTISEKLFFRIQSKEYGFWSKFASYFLIMHILIVLFIEIPLDFTFIDIEKNFAAYTLLTFTVTLLTCLFYLMSVMRDIHLAREKGLIFKVLGVFKVAFSSKIGSNRPADQFIEQGESLAGRPPNFGEANPMKSRTPYDEGKFVTPVSIKEMQDLKETGIQGILDTQFTSDQTKTSVDSLSKKVDEELLKYLTEED